ncbi:MAG: hypothetical protein AB1416_09715, partial [Actinomycetota bacterium]
MTSLARAFAALVAACALVAGCSGGQEDVREADPVQALRVLPTPAGLADAEPARGVDAAGLSRAYGSEAEIPGLADSGLDRAATRRWTGPGGATLVAAVGVWDDNEAARAVSGAAAEQPLGRPGARAWTPDSVGGSRGTRVEGAGARQLT